jgi:hypothetical protein
MLFALMKNWKKIMKKTLIGLTLVVFVFVFAMFAYNITSHYYYFGSREPPVFSEQVTFTNAYLKSSTVYLDTHSIQGNITFTLMKIHEIRQNETVNWIPIENVTWIRFSDSLLEGQTKTMSANFSSTFTSGNYCVVLYTSRGSCFVSPSFTVP